MFADECNPAKHRLKRPKPYLAILPLLILGALSVLHCQSREGDVYWIESWDDCVIDPDIDCEYPDPPECPNQPNQLISADKLMGYLAQESDVTTVIDVRDPGACQLNRIPGASCNYWDGVALADPIESHERPGYLVFYSYSSEGMEGLEETLPDFCNLQVMFLEDGIQGWNQFIGELERD